MKKKHKTKKKHNAHSHHIVIHPGVVFFTGTVIAAVASWVLVHAYREQVYRILIGFF